MKYREALDYVYGFADFERASTDRIRYRDFNLERVRALLEPLGDPHMALPTVHVAGTKGKGSTVAMIASILEAAGMRTGLFTSPHLHTVRERIAVGGAHIAEEEFVGEVERLAPVVARVNERGDPWRLTTFELLTAVAFLHFREAGAEVAVLETGLGGRLDATNVVMPEVCGITSISLDHTEVLGETLEKIAGEKAAIVKPGVPVVSAPQPEEVLRVIEAAAREAGSPLTVVGRDLTWTTQGCDLDGQDLRVSTAGGDYQLRTRLLGAHQAENAATAVAICERLVERDFPISLEAVRRGLAQVSWPGRLEVLGRDPLIVVDGAHNPYSMERLVEALRDHIAFRDAIVVFGATERKDLGGMVAPLAGLPVAGGAIATRSRHPKAASAEGVAAEMAARGIAAEQAPHMTSALTRARELAGSQDLVLVTGSLFVVAEAREVILGIEPEIFRWEAPLGV